MMIYYNDAHLERRGSIFRVSYVVKFDSRRVYRVGMMLALEHTTPLLAREEGAESNNRREEAAKWNEGGRDFSIFSFFSLSSLSTVRRGVPVPNQQRTTPTRIIIMGR
jgi:hypothetical protein